MGHVVKCKLITFWNLKKSTFFDNMQSSHEEIYSKERISMPQHQASARTNGASIVNNDIYGSSQSCATDPFQHVAPSLCVSSILCPPYQSLNSPAKYVVPIVTAQAAQPPALQIPQSFLTQVGAQQYVPVSVVEQNGRQMVFANALQPEWPGNRQMFVLSWQPRAFHQLVIPEAETWGRPLVLERAALLPEQPSLIPVEVQDTTVVYNHLKENNELNSLLPPQGSASTSNLAQPWTIMPAPTPFATATSNQQHRHIQQASSSHRVLSKKFSNTPSKRPAKAIAHSIMVAALSDATSGSSTLLSSHYSGNFSKPNDPCLVTHFFGRDQRDLLGLEDAESNLMLSMDQDKIPYRIGDVFAFISVDEAQQMLEEKKENVNLEAKGFCDQRESIKQMMSDLKVQLYSKFGNNINLEPE